MSDLSGKTVLVVGLGLSGSAAARVLVAQGARVRLSEQRSGIAEGAALEAIGVEVLTGGHERSHLSGVDLVVASPGVEADAPILSWAREAGLPIWSELELGARLSTVSYVAVTGTNGKTTTTEMIAAAMRAAGLKAVACGNIGHPFSLAVREPHGAFAVEASSFQLQYIDEFHPRVSVLLNLAPDHLDWHGDFDRYAAAKARIFENQVRGDTHVGNADDPLALALSSQANCETVSFTLGYPDPGQTGYEEGELLSNLGSDIIRLGHPSSDSAGFLADAAAAAAASLAFGLEPAHVSQGIRSVELLPHRGTVVAQMAGVSFVNDSKATNPHAALAALEGRTDVVLIAGGLSKGVDLSPLASAGGSLKGVVAIGDAASEIATIFEGLVPVRKAGSMGEAVEAATELVGSEGTVLLAPACASQDMFTDYQDRGERFAESARRVAQGASDG